MLVVKDKFVTFALLFPQQKPTRWKGWDDTYYR